MKRAVAMLVLLSLLGACGPGTAPEQTADRNMGRGEAEQKKRKPQKRPEVLGDKSDGPQADGRQAHDKDLKERSRASSSVGTSNGQPTAPSGDTRGPSQEESGAALAARAPEPIPQGHYEYETDGRRTVSGNTRPMPATTLLSVEAPRDRLQRQIRDLRDDDGQGTVTETHLLYETDGVYLSYVKVTSSVPGGFTDVREFRLPRPVLIASAGSGPGFERTFTMTGSGTRADVSIKALHYDKVKAAGRTIRSLVVQTDIAFSGALEGEQRSLSWYWPDHLWAVKEHVETDVRNGPIRLQGEYDAWLR